MHQLPPPPGRGPRVRTYHFSTRNPLVGALVLLLVLGVLAALAAVVTVGAVALGAAAAVGAGALALTGAGRARLRRRRGAAERALGDAGRAPRGPRHLPLDPSREVFPESRDERLRLPPAP